MPEQDTTYWCSVQKNPSLPTKHHIVGVSTNLLTNISRKNNNINDFQFSPVLDTPLALRHTHHFTIYRCSAPEGSTDEEFFERFVGHPGDECYSGSPEVPKEYCQGFLYIWAAGGKVSSYNYNSDVIIKVFKTLFILYPYISVVSVIIQFSHLEFLQLILFSSQYRALRKLQM